VVASDSQPTASISASWIASACAVWAVAVLAVVAPAALTFATGDSHRWVVPSVILLLALAGCLETFFGVLRQRVRGQSKSGALAIMAVSGGMILICAYSNLTDFPLIFLPVCPAPWCVPPLFMAIFPPLVVYVFGLTLGSNQRAT